MTRPVTGTALSPRAVLSLALFAGFAAALGELVALAVQKFVFHDVLRLSPHVIWMTPLNDTIVFTCLAGALLLLELMMRRDTTLRLAATLLACPVGLASIYLLPIESKAVRFAASAISIAVAAVLLMRVMRAAGPRRVCIFIIAFAATYAVALAIPRLFAIATVLLSAGAAMRLTTLIDATPDSFARMRRALVPLALLFALGGGVVVGWRTIRERRAIAALPAAVAGARNVIVIIWDTVRSSSVSLYGYARPTTPNLDRLAQRSVTFDQAFVTAPWTLPSHASMFTGHFTNALTADIRTPLDDAFPTVAERLSGQGIVTAGFIANQYYCDAENGLARGFVHYEDFVVTPGEIVLATTFGRAINANARVRRLLRFYDVVARRNADDINAAFLRWVDHRPKRPFFAFLNYYDAHLPYLPPEPWASRFGPQHEEVWWHLDHSRIRTAELFGRNRLPANQKRALLDAYEGGIAYMDDRLGVLLDSLQRRGVLENTVVIVTSDHGEHQGEHGGIYGHNASLFTQETRVPLVIHDPAAANSPARIAAPVSLRDLAATMIDMARVPAAPLPGRSLARYWTGPVPAAGTDTVFSSYPRLGLNSVAVGRYHIISRTRKPIQLYDLTTDPDEKTDLAATPTGAGVVAAMSKEYGALLTSKPRRAPDPVQP